MKNMIKRLLVSVICGTAAAVALTAYSGGPVTTPGSSASSSDRLLQRGVVASDDFVRGALGSNYTHVGGGAAASVSFTSGLLSVRASTNGASDPKDHTKFTGAIIGDSDNYELTVRWRAVGADNGRAGPGWGFVSTEALGQGTSAYVQFHTQPVTRGAVTVATVSPADGAFITAVRSVVPSTLPVVGVNDVMNTRISARGPLWTITTYNESNGGTAYMRAAEVVDWSSMPNVYIPGTVAQFAIFHRWSDFDVLDWEYRDLNPKSPDVLVIGDSISRGYNALAAPWVKELRDAGLTVATVTGAGMGFADHANILAQAAGYTPKNIVVALGTNDVAQSRPQATIEADIAALQSGLAALGASATYWCTPAFAAGADRSVLRGWMTANLPNVIDVWPLFTFGINGINAPLLSDGLHYTAEGHSLHASLVLRALGKGAPSLDIGGRPHHAARSLTIPDNNDIDFSRAQMFTRTLSADTTFTFSGFTDGQRVRVYVTNPGASHAVTWPTTVIFNSVTYTVKWTSGSAPTQTAGAKTDRYDFVVAGTTIYAEASQNF